MTQIYSILITLETVWVIFHTQITLCWVYLLQNYKYSHYNTFNDEWTDQNPQILRGNVFVVLQYNQIMSYLTGYLSWWVVIIVWNDESDKIKCKNKNVTSTCQYLAVAQLLVSKFVRGSLAKATVDEQCYNIHANIKTGLGYMVK